MLGQMDAVEVYSRPRVAQMTEKMGFRAGWSVELTNNDEQGRPWDFNNLNMRNAAIRKFIHDKPRLFIGSPMCGPFSTMNNFNYAKMFEEEVQQRFNHGRTHLEFCMKFYEIQWREGRYFFNEHPEFASSWREECVQRFFMKTRGDQSSRRSMSIWIKIQRRAARRACQEEYWVLNRFSMHSQEVEFTKPEQERTKEAGPRGANKRESQGSSNISARVLSSHLPGAYRTDRNGSNWPISACRNQW